MSTPRLRPTPSPTHASIRTPLAKVRGLGASNEGTSHFWQQRVTALANIPLTIFLAWLVARYAGADHATVKAAMQKPWIAIPLLLLVLSGVFHMRIGMQVIIEDYVHGEGSKVLLLALNTFFSIAVGLTCVFAVLKLSFGA